MLRFWLVALMSWLSGCQMGSGQKASSKWAALDKSETLDCGQWPLREKDLQTNDIMSLDGASAEFVSSGLKRDASPIHYYMKFDGSVGLDPDDLFTLNLGRFAVILGGRSVPGKTLIVVAQNSSEAADIEVRSVKDNIVLYKSHLSDMPVTDGKLLAVPKGAWVAFRRDDNFVQLAFIDFAVETKITTTVVKDLSFDDFPTLLPAQDKKGVIAVVRTRDPKRPFDVRFIGQNGRVESAATLDLKIEKEVESWAAHADKKGYLIAFIDGDSLVGQAKLRTAAFHMDGGIPQIIWDKDLTIRDTHVSEPVFMTAREGVEIMLLNWVDEESTIARYRVSGEGLSQSGFSGIFPKGSRIMSAFEHNGDRYVLVRHRGDMKWNFEVCEL